MSNQLKNLEKLTPLTQYKLLVEHNFISSCHNSKNSDTNLNIVVEPTHFCINVDLFIVATFSIYMIPADHSDFT